MKLTPKNLTKALEFYEGVETKTNLDKVVIKALKEALENRKPSYFDNIIAKLSTFDDKLISAIIASGDYTTQITDKRVQLHYNGSNFLYQGGEIVIDEKYFWWGIPCAGITHIIEYKSIEDFFKLPSKLQ